MYETIPERLQAPERDYCAGVGFERLGRRIDDIVRRIEGLGAADPLRQACETFAPTLWGGTSGSEISAEAVQPALAGQQGPDCLRACAHFPRVVDTYRPAA